MLFQESRLKCSPGWQASSCGHFSLWCCALKEHHVELTSWPFVRVGGSTCLRTRGPGKQQWCHTGAPLACSWGALLRTVCRSTACLRRESPFDEQKSVDTHSGGVTRRIVMPGLLVPLHWSINQTEPPLLHAGSRDPRTPASFGSLEVRWGSVSNRQERGF